MSIASEIARLQGVKADILAAIAAKGVTVPSGSALDDCPALIAGIPTGITPPTGFKLYSRLLFDSGYGFQGTGTNGLNSIIIDSDDSLELNIDFDPSLADKNAYCFLFNFQASDGWSSWRRVGFIAREGYYQFCYDTTTFGSQLSYLNKITPLSILDTATNTNVNNNIYSHAQESRPHYSCIQLSSYTGENSFYSFIVRDSTETNIKAQYVPALRLSDNTKGIVDIKSGSFVAVNNSSHSYLMG